MRIYTQTTSRTFYGNEWFGKVKNIPSSKIRNKMLRLYDKNDVVLVLLPTVKSRTTIKRYAI